jgi:glycosyltransferase involved in cell wall biosynthesis
MRVLFVQGQPCIRALKYAVALHGHTLGFAYVGRTLSEWYGCGDELFEDWSRLGDDPAGDLERAIDEFEPDLIHSHNLPDSLTVLALELVDGEIPVVHDAHDLFSLRRTPYEDGLPEPADPLALEKLAIEGSAALISVSDEMTAAIRARHRPPRLVEAFPNYALARDLPSTTGSSSNGHLGRPPRIVYQGTLSTNGGHYDLREIFGAVVGAGAELDVYASRPAPEYRELAEATPGMSFHDTLPPALLFRELARYDLGWAGFNASVNGPHLDTALPNKLFDYLGCGLPVLTLRHSALRRFVEREGVGLSLESPDELGERLRGIDIAALRRRVKAIRPRVTVEANIHRIERLYAAALAAEDRRGAPIPSARARDPHP